MSGARAWGWGKFKAGKLHTLPSTLSEWLSPTQFEKRSSLPLTSGQGKAAWDRVTSVSPFAQDFVGFSSRSPISRANPTLSEKSWFCLPLILCGRYCNCSLIRHHPSPSSPFSLLVELIFYDRGTYFPASLWLGVVMWPSLGQWDKRRSEAEKVSFLYLLLSPSLPLFLHLDIVIWVCDAWSCSSHIVTMREHPHHTLRVITWRIKGVWDFSDNIALWINPGTTDFLWCVITIYLLGPNESFVEENILIILAIGYILHRT